MDLSNIDKFVKDKERRVWAEYCPDFEVQLCYLSLPERTKAFEKANRTVLRGGLLQQDGVRKAVEANTVRMIGDWHLPVRVLAQLIEVEVEDLGDPEAMVPCTEANKLTLMRRAGDFGNWVNNLATVLENFRAEEVRAEVENLSQS